MIRCGWMVCIGWFACAQVAEARIPVVAGEAAIHEAAQYTAAGNKGAMLSRWEAGVIDRNVRAVIDNHSTWDRGIQVLDPNLEHFHDDHGSYAPHEEDLARRRPGHFREVFGRRLDHARGCPVCAGLMRECLVGTGIALVDFVPNPQAMPLNATILANDRWVPVRWRRAGFQTGFYGDCGTYFGAPVFLGPPRRCAGAGGWGFDGGLHAGGLHAGGAPGALRLGWNTGWYVDNYGCTLPIRFFR